MGICDGVPNAMGKEMLLGDIAISNIVIEYGLGRRYADRGREKDTLDTLDTIEERLGRPVKNVRSLITAVNTDIGLEGLEEKVSFYLRKMQSRASENQYQRRPKAAYRYPGSANDLLFESTYCHKTLWLTAMHMRRSYCAWRPHMR